MAKNYIGNWVNKGKWRRFIRNSGIRPATANNVTLLYNSQAENFKFISGALHDKSVRYFS